MKRATIIFPHQLFANHPAISREREIFLVEGQLFFSGGHLSLQFHKKKLVLHRASMQAYKKMLRSQGYRVHYIEFESDLFQSLIKHGIEEIWLADTVDKWLESKLKREALKSGMAIHRLPSPEFLTPEDWLFSFFQRIQASLHDAFLRHPEKKAKRLGQRGQTDWRKMEFRSGKPKENS